MEFLVNCTGIPYTRVPRSSTLLLDYLYHYDRVASFYSGSPFAPLSYKTLASLIPSSGEGRQHLAEVLRRQNEAFGAAEPTFAGIRRLSQPGTFAVVTGQQVGLLSGPAFTLYKALTAVRLAQALSEQGLPAVPVFWLADQDHDLEEVAHIATFDDGYELISLTDRGERPAARSSVGHVKLSGEIDRALGLLERSLPAGEPRERLLHDLRETYRPGATWAEAFGCFMARLFSRWGVVLLDPLDEAVHRLGARVYQQALARAGELRQRLLERSQALLQAGYHAQVHVTEESTLVFVTQEGNRVALTQRDGEFLLDGSEKISLAELKARAETQPLGLSPNVLLRPVVQDILLPTLAYVAGPSELAYLGQANALYAIFGRPQPVIFPRAGFTLVDRRIQHLMEKYRVNVEDVWQGEEHLGRRIAATGIAAGWAERFDQSEQELARLLEPLRQDVETLDPTLLDALHHTQEKVQYQMDRLRGKLSRAALQRSELLGRHAQSLLRFLTPRKSLQEREVSGVYFLGRVGYELLDRLLAHVRADCSDHQVLAY